MFDATLSNIPPVVSVPVEFALDRVIARDTARRVTSTLGFSPAGGAQIGSAVAHVCELLLKTNAAHELHLSGITDGERTGLQVLVKAPWLAGTSAERVTQSLNTRLGELVDRVWVATGTAEGSVPYIVLVAWCR